MEKNFVLIVKYECGESAFLTDTPDLIKALDEYNKQRLAMLNEQSKHFSLPIIREAHIYRLFKDVSTTI